MSGVSTTIPLPYTVQPTWSWDGNDGNWSTFSITIGTPGQSFRVLPSTSVSETWIPIIEGCEGILTNVSDCGNLRGINNGRGFQVNQSSTWEQIGIYGLASEQYLFNSTSDVGLYGLDSIGVNSADGGVYGSLPAQVVSGLATGDFWLGSLGLGNAEGNFTVQDTGIPSLISSMKNASRIPSMSYGYAAGASYRGIPGSLVLGGYDADRFTSNDVNFVMGGPTNTSLGVEVSSIITLSSLSGGSMAMLPNGESLVAAIDSTVAQSWFPQAVCDQFAQAFGLTYDPVTELYLVNDTIHTQLQQMNTDITFTIKSNDTSTATTNIKLPYAAFDLEVGIPFYNDSTPYFPIRVAGNDSQIVLGRSFLQEAYIFVDWEAGNFTVAQATQQNNTVSITSVHVQIANKHKSGLATGAIVGIVVGIVAVIAILAGVFFFLKIRARRRKSARAEATKAETYSDDNKDMELENTNITELGSSQVHELHQDSRQLAELHQEAKLPAELHTEDSKTELMSTPINELPGHAVGQELEDTGRDVGVAKNKRNSTVYELP